MKDAVQGRLGAELGEDLEVATKLDELVEGHWAVDGPSGVLWVDVLQGAVELAHEVYEFARIDQVDQFADVFVLS